MAKVGQHAPLAEQLAELAEAIEEAGKGGGEATTAVAERGREFLALAKELARDIAGATRQAISVGQGTVEQEIDMARGLIRQHPLTAIVGAAAIAAVIAGWVTAASRRR